MKKIDNKYYLKDVRQYSQDDLGDGLVYNQRITYNDNKHLSTVRVDDYLVYYTYSGNQLARIQMGDLGEVSSFYELEYYPLDKYTKVTNNQLQSNFLYYNRFEQKNNDN